MSTLDRTFTAPLQKSPAKGAWTYVVTERIPPTPPRSTR
jgi:hypothetical protein